MSRAHVLPARSARLLLLGGLALAGCRGDHAVGSSSPRTSFAALAAAPPIDRFVVLDARTPLCRGPALESGCVALPPGVRWARFEAVARVLEDRGAWLLVETTDPWQLAQHCADDSNTLLSLLGLRLRFFVQRSALVPVTEAQTLAYPNGTGVTLRAGVPLQPPEGDVPRDLAVVDPDEFSLLLPRWTLRTSETYVEAAPIAETPQALAIAGGRAMRYGAPLPAKDFPADPEGHSSATTIPEAPGILRHPFHPTDVYAQAPHPDGVLVELRSACAILQVVVAPDAVKATTPRRFHGRAPAFLLSKTRTLRTSRWRVRAGAPLFFADGTPAGAVGPLAVPFHGTEKSASPRVCLERGLFGAEPPRGATPEQVARATLTLCADATDATPWPRFLRDADAAAIGPDTRTYVSVEVDNRSELDAVTVTAEVRGALADALLVMGSMALAPAGQTALEARAFAGARGLEAAHVRVEVGPVEVSKTSWFYVRRRVTASIARADGTTSAVPSLTGGMSPGADDVSGGAPTAAFLRHAFEHAIEQEVMAIRAVLMAGEHPPDPTSFPTLDALPAWAFPLGFGR
jgi:hypothetical protein